MIQFRTFWFLALLSNVAATGQTLAIMWQLGDARFPPLVLIAYQTATVVGTLAGVWLGATIVSKIGYRKTLIAASLLEGLACVVVAVAAYSTNDQFDEKQGYVVAIACLGVALAAAMCGPAWIAIVARWPGTANETGQILLDNAQSQLGRFLGPLAAGLLLTTLPHSVQWLSIANAATYVGVATIIIFLRVENDDDHPNARPVRIPANTLSLLQSRVAWSIAAVAVSSDSARTFLPRLMRETGQNEAFYSWTVAILSLSAAITSFAVSRKQAKAKTLAIVGLLGLSVGLALWGVSNWIGSWLWIAGAVFLGGSTSIAAAGLIGLMMDLAGRGRRSFGAATATIIRTVFGPVGTLVVASFLPALGAMSFLAAGIVTLIASGAIITGRPSSGEGETPLNVAFSPVPSKKLDADLH